MRKFLFLSLMSLFGVMAFVSCDKADNPATPSEPDTPSEAPNGILKVTTDIGDWDAAYVTDWGSFCYTDNMGSKEEGGESFSNLTFIPSAGSGKVSLIISKENNLPSQAVLENGVVYFSFPNDSILEIVFDNNEEMEFLESIPFRKALLQEIIEANGYDGFKSILSNVTELLNNASHPIEVIWDFKNVVDAVIKLAYDPDSKLADEIQKDSNGNYNFANQSQEWYDTDVFLKVYHKLTIWTGKATFKVGGSSCTLSGSIFCPVNTFNTYGVYGILCDTDPAKLTTGNAEYEGTGFQAEKEGSFDVDFRGLKPNTTYYYRAFYKFNDADHGGLQFQYGGLLDQVGYDETIKSFTTGDNMLSVDVVMAIDVTGSMSGIINTVKRNALGFYDSFLSACTDEGIILTELRSQVIAFQDKNVDGDRWFFQSPTYSLPSDKEQFDTYVNALYADGGGDIPESGLEALDAAFRKSDWGTDDGYHRQVIILWTDAPYLIAPYSDVTLEGIKALWDNMPSGRRLILFAPNGNGYSNGGDWANFNSWKNVIHETNLSSGFNNFEYILKSIIGELTSKAPKKAPAISTEPYFFRSN